MKHQCTVGAYRQDVIKYFLGLTLYGKGPRPMNQHALDPFNVYVVCSDWQPTIRRVFMTSFDGSPGKNPRVTAEFYAPGMMLGSMDGLPSVVRGTLSRLGMGIVSGSWVG